MWTSSVGGRTRCPCADFLCSGNVRVPRPVSGIDPDPAEVVERQIHGLRLRARQFLDRVQGA
ncbi:MULTISPECIES: FBP domain-containing protein [unclassified Arthrobacter]|uniref:FBP domain-containing protein n=1 Tax=unclassified Arthrobacter TaxID=235627 RepID=UPI002E163DA7|nr:MULTISPECIES: FBP domain-containing protein [unclassified Arthrobacter]